MRTHPRSRARSPLLAFGIIVALVVVTAPGAAAATPVDCTSDPSALQPALDAAEPEDVLEIKGRCVGTFSVNTSVTLRGNGTLDGAGEGPVLYVDAFTAVTIEDLTITHGSAASGGGIYVEFFSSARLRGSATVTRNRADRGGGVYVAGFLGMHDSSSVRGNSAAIAGGGIWDGSGVIMNNSSTVSGNTASSSGGGVYVVAFRGLQLNDSASISGNRAMKGGGVSASVEAELALNGEASVTGNAATEMGGGIETAGPLFLNDTSSVNGNTAGTKALGGTGGGIATVTSVALSDRAKIQGNKAIGPGADGGGIHLSCVFAPGEIVLNGGRVKSNKPNDIVTIPGDCDGG